MTTLTPRDVAADLNLSLHTVGEYLRDGHIPGAFQVYEGGPWRVDADRYAEWKTARQAAVDPHRIAPRSQRSKGAQQRRRAS